MNRTSEEFKISILRRNLLLAGAIYPSWYYIFLFVNKDYQEYLLPRLCISALAISFFALSYVRKLSADTFESMFTFVGVVLMAYSNYTVNLNRLDYFYVLATVMAFFSITLGFFSKKKILIYTVLSIGSMLLLDGSNAPFSKAGYIAISVTLGLVSYITFAEKHQLFRLLEASRQRLQEILDRLPVGAVYLDRGEVYMNTIAENLFGVKASSFSSESSWRDFLRLHLKSRNAPESESNSNTKYFSLSTNQMTEKIIQCVSYQDEELEIWILLDETEKLVARANMLHSAKMASLGTMAGGIAHEINNPLAIIKGYAEVLMRKMKKVELSFDEQKNLAQTIFNTVNRIENIVLALKSFSRQEPRAEMKLWALQSIFQTVNDICSKRLSSEFIKFTIVAPPEEIRVKCHQVDISQILINLINNSADAVKGSVGPWIELSAMIEESNVVVKVMDSGKGINKEVMQKIFEPFYTTKDVGQGTGLGLSISRSLAKQNSGTLIYDETSAQTCFKLTLPLYKEELISAS